MNFFIGHEDISNLPMVSVNNAIMGSIKAHWFVKECLQHLQATYDGTEMAHFGGPVLTTEQLQKYIELKKNKFQQYKDIYIFPCTYFHPLPYREFILEQKKTPNYISKDTYTIHHFAGSWISSERLFWNGKFLEGFNNLQLNSDFSLYRLFNLMRFFLGGLVRTIFLYLKNETKYL